MEMPDIIVGVDGSGHSQRALIRAIKEAAAHHVPLTVLTVHQAIMGFGGGPVVYREDLPETERAREAVQAETDKALAEVGEPRPESVTVKAVHGFPAEVLIDASRDADMIVLGQRGVGGFSRLLMGSVTSQVAHHATCPVLIVPSEHR
jgi:nucleotide-binding universal stress UspA family protein